MKINIKFFIAIILICLLFSCITKKNILVFENIDNGKDISIEFTKGKAFNHPTFVIWLEDMDGSYLKTLFLTKAYANCLFEHKMLGDTLWLNEKGESCQPAALSYWTHKKGMINNKTLVPSKKNKFVDAYTGATPKGSFVFNAKKSEKKQYRLLVEINQTWDWNKFWTNNKYPENSAYKHSAQPSIIYGVAINNMDSTFYLNPIGHGDPKGESGKLFTNISTLTSAKQIFSSIKVKMKK
ncbi:MAG: hypothetical protein IMY72_11640 [Bacteroidetes bacterium]|nr:hypothetical protein [Bacteroidota bacterium]